MSLRCIVSMCIIGITALTISAANRPFPLGVNFKNSVKPNHISQHTMDSVVSDMYFNVKKKYVATAKSQNGGYYVLSGGGTGGSEGLITISEAHGYGMITTALMGGTGPLADPEAQKIFDGMFQFFLDHPSDLTNNLMSWEVLTDNNGGESTKLTENATDGDMDIAYALLLAHYQWGSAGKFNYLTEAKRVITKGLKVWNMNDETMRTNLGDWSMGEEDYKWGSRPSDWMTGHMHAYAEATGDAFWTEAADTIYAMLNNFTTVHSPNTGLISDFVESEFAEPVGPNYLNEFPETGHYFENACRVPLRLVIDYAHFGSPTAGKTVQGMLDFIRTKTKEDPTKITFGYNISTGKELHADSTDMEFTAPFIAGAIASADNQTFLNKGWDILANTRQTYYSDYLNLLSMLIISGNWWAPVKQEPVDLDPFTAKSRFNGISTVIAGGNLNLNFNLSGITSDLPVQIFGINGREMAHGVAKAENSGSYSASLSMANLGSSVYMIRIGNQQFSHTAKIVLK